MSKYLDDLERQLVGALQEPHPGAGPLRTMRRREGGTAGGSFSRAIPAGLIAAVLLLLIAAAVAIAITGVLATGSSVRPATRPLPTAGNGVPTPAGARLSSALAPDPAGGPPWGMRIVRTTRGLNCLQLGRVEDGQLGVIGTGGAFHDDGRFHPLPADALETGGRAAQGFVTCMNPGEHTALGGGVSVSGVWGRWAGTGPARRLSFGVLGPDAVSVSFESEAGVRTLPVEPGTGAYVVALPHPRADELLAVGGGSGRGLLSPQGAISLITYRVHGRLCSQPNLYPHGPRGGHDYGPCPHGRPDPAPGRPTRLHRHIAARITRGGTAIVSFRAPFAVTSARAEYTLQVVFPCRYGTTGTSLERDVGAGEVVRMRFPHVFGHPCGSSVSLRIVYAYGGLRNLFDAHEVIVGERTFAR